MPIFLWSIGSNAIDYSNGHIIPGTTFLEFFTSSVLGSALVSIIHFLFAIIGSVIAWLILKLKEGK
ncbi:hypothetical protein [Anaerobacillus sp. CMMVII]|uniref:hypothetical protein n=1 Tax=Anaerobacillus sp. CMMVII TaxID=2755588 RepID=UPI0021B83CA0|nr:hypothetical protein [Anaerobacillus sp. CMMVII]